MYRKIFEEHEKLHNSEVFFQQVATRELLAVYKVKKNKKQEKKSSSK